MRLFTRLLKDIKYLQRVTLHLQKEDVILSDCRTIFDDILGKYPYLDKYLPVSRTRHIIQFKSFENGLIKLMNNDEVHLTFEERTEMKIFLIMNDDDNNDKMIMMIIG